jgi:dihydroflavonol-4-reductase
MSEPMYIVTGATGHIGNNVTRYLLNQNEDVRVLVRRIDRSLEGLSCDIRISQTFDDTFLDQAIHERDVIIHCAAYIDLMNQDIMNTFRTNLQLTKRLVQIAKQKNCRFVYISSVDVIAKEKRGHIKEPLTIDVDDHKSYYKSSKASATNYVIEHMKQGLNGIILYPSAVIGIHDYKPSAAGREILHAIRHRCLFSVRGGYNFIDVEDVSRAIYQASRINSIDHMILSGEDITIKELYMAIKKITGKKKLIFTLPTWLVRFAIIFSKKYSQMMITTIQENYHYDHTIMVNSLHVTPKPLEQTLRETITWLQQNY